MIMLRRTLLLLAVMVVVPGCDVAGPACGDYLDIRVSSRNGGVISWDPGCVVHEVTVERLDTHETVWSLEGRIRPPLNYGETPGNSKVVTRAIALVTGKPYYVKLLKGDGEILRIVGYAEFTPN